MEIGQRVKDYWTQSSHDFGTVRKNELENEMGQRWLHEIERFLPEGRSLDILDVGTGTGFGGDLKVAVTVEGGTITAVEVLSHGDTAGVCDPALEKIPAEIVESQSADVDIAAGATFTSNGIIAAVKNALGL